MESLMYVYPAKFYGFNCDVIVTRTDELYRSFILATGNAQVMKQIVFTAIEPSHIKCDVQSNSKWKWKSISNMEKNIDIKLYIHERVSGL